MESLFEKAKKIIAQDQHILALFEEYDRTHKLKRKITYKQRYNFTLDEDLMAQFRRYSAEHHAKMSTLLESLIRNKLQSEKS